MFDSYIVSYYVPRLILFLLLFLKVFTEGYHQLRAELEPVKSETLNLIASWITERVEPTSKI